MENKIKHLEFIQQTIHRLADNSFRLKQWSVFLAAATLALLSQRPTSTGWDCLISLIPVLVFWGLDGYFLWQERLYRKLYDQVRILNENEIDFSMNTYHFQTNPKPFVQWLCVTLSKTLFPFYGSFALLILIACVIVIFAKNVVGLSF